MSKIVWKKLGSPELKPSEITLRAYTNLPSTLVGLSQGILIQIYDKTILIDIEVHDA